MTKGTKLGNSAENRERRGSKIRVSRRAILKGMGTLAATAASSGPITGFPTVWAQEIKDIELRHVGVDRRQHGPDIRTEVGD